MSRKERFERAWKMIFPSAAVGKLDCELVDTLMSFGLADLRWNRLVHSGPNFLAQQRMVLPETTTPRPSNICSTKGMLKGKRKQS